MVFNSFCDFKGVVIMMESNLDSSGNINFGNSNSRLRLIFVFFVIATAGCSGRPEVDQFTHFWTSQGSHVWSHLGVELIQIDSEVLHPPEFFISRELKPGEAVKLVGGVVIRYDGITLSVDERIISEDNVLIEKDGRILSNAYIKTDR